MKITLFTENYYRGGVDTFIITLLNNWPEAADEFTLVCNEDHPGLKDIREKLRRSCRIVTHRIRTYDGLAARMRDSRLSRRGDRYIGGLPSAASPQTHSVPPFEAEDPNGHRAVAPGSTVAEPMNRVLSAGPNGLSALDDLEASTVPTEVALDARPPAG